MNNIKKIIVINSVKGGVGKSTIISNIAVFLNKKNKKVGILDVDIYGASQEKILGIKNIYNNENNYIIPQQYENIKIISINSLIKKNKLIILKFPVINKIINDLLYNVEWGYLDYLLIDLPAGSGDIHINIIQKIKIDYAIIITTPQKTAFNISKKSIYMFKKLNIPIIGIIENFSYFSCSFCKKKNSISNININKKIKKYKIKIIEKIPLFSEISNINLLQKSYKNKKITDIFNKITNVIINYKKNINIYYYKLQKGKLKIKINKTFKNINLYKLRELCSCIKCEKIKTKSRLIYSNNISKKIYIKNIYNISNYWKIYFSDKHTVKLNKKLINNIY